MSIRFSVVSGEKNPDPSVHARLVCAIIKSGNQSGPNTNEPHGYPPESDLYSAKSFADAALAWAIGQKCTVINHNAHRTIAAYGGEISEQDIYSDWLATHNPYPTILSVSRSLEDVPNDRNPLFVVAKAFNAIPVGAHASLRDDISESRIPNWCHFKNQTSPHSDRELPLLACPRLDISALGITLSGISFAAPAVTGAVALMQSVAPTLLANHPAACRAITLASAGRKVSNGVWAADIAARVDARDGAGTLDVDAAVQVAQAHSSSPSSSAAAGKAQWPRGWSSGVYTSPLREDTIPPSLPSSYGVVLKQGY
ncbi:MAG: hypothetical protein Q9210_001153 [Variospora velana]